MRREIKIGKFIFCLITTLISASFAQEPESPLTKKGASLQELVATGRARFEARNETELRQMKAAFEERERKRGLEQGISRYQANLIIEFGRAIDASIRKHTVSVTSKSGAHCTGLMTEAGLIVPLHAVLQATSHDSLQAGQKPIGKNVSKQLFPSCNLVVFQDLPSGISIREQNQGPPPSPGAFICSWLSDGRIATGTVSTTDVSLSNQESDSIRAGRKAHWKKTGFTPSSLVTELTEGIECDLSVEEKDLGSPVFDLKGNLVGITVARLDAHRTVVIPSIKLQRVFQLSAR